MLLETDLVVEVFDAFDADGSNRSFNTTWWRLALLEM
jgi:hypothetical protein